MRLTDDQIGAGLHALRATPSERFAAELDAWAAEDFPTMKQLEPTGRRFQFVRRRPVLAAVAGSLMVVGVVAVSVAAYLNANDVRTDSGGEPLGAVQDFSTKVESAPQAAAGTASNVAPAPLPPTGTRPRNGQQQVQARAAQLGLATDANELQDAADGVVDVTDRYDGFVDSSNVHTGGSHGRASFELRIPTQHLQDALSDFADLGRVTLLDQASNNVTGTYVDAGKAFRDARAKVDSLLEDLQHASSPSEAASIKQQLVIAREQLAAARTALRGLKQRVAYTPVSVDITAQGDGSWSIGDAADDAVGVLEAIAGAALITLAVLVPLAALIALGWYGAR